MDNHFWAKYLISVLSNFILLTLIYLAILRQWIFTKVQFILFVIYVPIQSLFKTIFMSNTIINLSISVLSGLVFPCILYVINKNKITWKFLLLNVLLTNAFDFCFQLISLVIKNLSIKILDDKLLIDLIFTIDVFIMEALYYLYVNKLHQEKINKERSI